ncbi:MAG: GGDEF domain-containing protein [Planctomycetota bacterium]|nr:GGDEF domain-containing protein [Planctomycetota bacterium]
MLGFERLPKWAILAVCLAATAAIEAADYLTGEHIMLSSFYLVPIALATWYLGRTAGILFCLLGVTSELIIRRFYASRQEDFLTSLWNEIIILTFFVAVAYVLDRLRTALHRESLLARTDSLTGAANLRCFTERLQLERERAARNGRPLTLVYMDLDDFKRVNDEDGHAAGDRLLHLFAQTVRKETRSVDLLGRVGGDEFCLLMPDTDSEQARAVLVRLQEKLEDMFREQGHPVTMSVGVVTFLKPPQTVDEMIGAADAAMYEAKNGGKDAVRFVTHPVRPRPVART